jgi:hypothetical protein
MKPLQKAILIRESAYLKSQSPHIAYRNRLKGPEQILYIIESSNVKNSIKLEARRQYIVALCAAFETYWRDFFKLMVDLYKIPVEKGSQLNKIVFTFADMREIVGRKLTLGELVTTAYVFQSLDAVNQAASEILGIDAFRTFAESKIRVSEVPRKNRSKKHGKLLQQDVPGKTVFKNISNIEKAFKMRHETVHHTGTRYRPSQRDVLKFDGEMFNFKFYFSSFVDSRARKLKN